MRVSIWLFVLLVMQGLLLTIELFQKIHSVQSTCRLKVIVLFDWRFNQTIMLPFRDENNSRVSDKLKPVALETNPPASEIFSVNFSAPDLLMLWPLGSLCHQDIEFTRGVIRLSRNEILTYDNLSYKYSVYEELRPVGSSKYE